MENKPEGPTEKKILSRARSYNTGPGPTPLKLKNEPAKRKSFNLNEAVKSLDLALGRLKKSKLVNGEYNTNTAHTSPIRGSGTSADMLMEMSSPSCNGNAGANNASLMSMNFSHYELMRNLSRSTSNSESAFSGTTCNAYPTPADTTLKDEHLEKYFRSAEIWSRKLKDGCHNTVHFEIPEK